MGLRFLLQHLPLELDSVWEKVLHVLMKGTLDICVAFNYIFPTTVSSNIQAEARIRGYECQAILVYQQLSRKTAATTKPLVSVHEFIVGLF